MKGRKPKLRLVQGGPAAPQKPARAPRCPAPPNWLSAEAKREWRKVAPQLHRRQLLKPEVAAVLANYAMAVGLVRGYREQLRLEGHVVMTKDGPRTHPAFKMLMAALREARLHAAELGVTPHRLSTRGKQDAEAAGDDWPADLLA
jgi:P27 family predicted phage terminase small subunit